MILWRLSTTPFARRFDGGYGLNNTGRWNSVGRRVTYCATSPALCALERLVHIEDPDNIPALSMVIYEAPDEISTTTIGVEQLASRAKDWRSREDMTQIAGDNWHQSRQSALLIVPSAIIPIPSSPDLNIVVNHEHPEAAQIAIKVIDRFAFDLRLL